MVGYFVLLLDHSTQPLLKHGSEDWNNFRILDRDLAICEEGFHEIVQIEISLEIDSANVDSEQDGEANCPQGWNIPPYP